MKRYRYYSPNKPIDLPEIPKGNKILELQNYERRSKVFGIDEQPFGYIDFEKPLTEDEEKKYDLCGDTKNEYFLVHTILNTSESCQFGFPCELTTFSKFEKKKPENRFYDCEIANEIELAEWFDSEEEQEKRYNEICKFIKNIEKKNLESAREFFQQIKGENKQ